MQAASGCKFTFQSLADTPGLRIWDDVLPAREADALLAHLRDTLPWSQPQVRIFGKLRKIPRLQSWHGDCSASYRYSGLPLAPAPWTPALAGLRERIQELLHHPFNSVLANLYRDGRDSMGWHADNEPELGPAPWIASFSLGAQRDFALRRAGSTRTALLLPLRHNQLLLMPPAMQAHWQHALPRRLRVSEARINLTFRHIQPLQPLQP